MKDKWVVVIDNDSEDCFILRQAFQRWRPEVNIEEFCFPGQLLDSSRWKTKDPDVILLELVLGGEDGLDWLSVFLNHECCQNSPVVIYSSLLADRQMCLELGATDFITKPFNFDDMQQVVDKVWQNWLAN